MKRITLLTITLALCVLSVNAQVMVKDIDPADKTSSDPRNLFSVNGTLYFSSKGDYASKVARGANTTDYETGLWRSDGTEAGTKFIGAFFPEFMIGVNASVYFVAQSPAGLWKYDGGANSSSKEEKANAKSGSFLKQLGGIVLENTTVNGKPAKQKDGSAGRNDNNSSKLPGMTLLKSMFPSFMGWSSGTLRGMNGELYFVFRNEKEDVNELWKTDGSTKGTTSTGVKFGGSISTHDLNLTVINSTLYFCAQDSTHGYELWKSDGTPAGTAMVKDINAVYSSTGDTLSSNPRDFINVNGTLFFTADDGVHGKQLWKSNGTAADTVMVKDFGPDGSSLTSVFGEMADVSGILYFTLNSHERSTPRIGSGYIETELWKTDGTEKGTVLVKDINLGDSSYPRDLTNVNGTLFFTANDGIHGRELWKSNGSQTGTVMVRDINTKPGSLKGTADSVPGTTSTLTTEGTPAPSLTNVNGMLYFVADDGFHGFELWKSDGTAAGTIMVKDIKPFGNFGSDPKDLTNVNGVLFFTADDGPHGRELWKYDVPIK